MNLLEINTISDIAGKILYHPVGIFSFVFGLMNIVGWLIFYITRKITIVTTEQSHLVKGQDKIESHIDKIKSDISDINGTLRFVIEKTEEIDNDVNKMKNDISEINKDIFEMKTTLNFAFAENKPFAVKNSPWRLNEEGKETVKKYSLDLMVEINWSKINRALQELKSQNPYDLEIFCFDMLSIDARSDTSLKYFEEKDIDKIKRLSYKSGIPLLFYSRMIGILIRNKYFKENNIDLFDTDEHSPSLSSKLENEIHNN